MSEAVRRIFVEKKDEFAVEAQGMLADLKENLSLDGLTGVRIINRYDVAGISDEEYMQARSLIFLSLLLTAATMKKLKLMQMRVSLRLSIFRGSTISGRTRRRSVSLF